MEYVGIVFTLKQEPIACQSQGLSQSFCVLAHQSHVRVTPGSMPTQHSTSFHCQKKNKNKKGAKTATTHRTKPYGTKLDATTGKERPCSGTRANKRTPFLLLIQYTARTLKMRTRKQLQELSSKPHQQQIQHARRPTTEQWSGKQRSQTRIGPKAQQKPLERGAHVPSHTQPSLQRTAQLPDHHVCVLFL